MKSLALSLAALLVVTLAQTDSSAPFLLQSRGEMPLTPIDC